MPVNDLLSLLVLALVSASIYAVAASGLVVTYTTSGIFNFAHGAVAMFAAFVYWQLSSPEAWGLPVWLSLVITLFVFAPALGLLIDRLLMRRLADAAPVTRIVVPIGLLVVLIQIAAVIWPPAEITARVPRFFNGQSVHVAGINIEYHSLVIFAAAGLVAIGLRVLLYNTRIGVAMRAVVDSRDLAALNGVSPDRVSGLSWALGCSLAALAGVLVAPILTLDQSQLTLLVINAYAAAMVGRLRSLPWTVVGAIILGLAREAANRYDDSLPNWITTDTVPALMLFVVLIVVPQERASIFAPRQDLSRVPNPSWRSIAIGSVALVAAALVLPSMLHGTTLDAAGYGLALSIVAVSLVPLTGYAGQISLAPLAFAGIGAVLMYWWGSDGNPLALLGVMAVCAVIGALVALPTTKLKGLYLALATFAFALFCEKAIFPNVTKFKQGDAVYERLHIGGLAFESDRSYLVMMAVVFALLGVGIHALRRGPTGRRLQAMKDSPAACATLGINPTRLKLEIFALSAAIAGLGGALLGGWRGKVGTEQFSLLQGSLPALPLILLAVVGGIAAVAGALLSGFLLALLPELAEAVPFLSDLLIITPGLAGVTLGSHPNGVVSQIVGEFRAARDRLKGEAEPPPDTASRRAMAMLAPPPPELVPELIGVGASARDTDVAVLDAETGLAWGRCDVDP